MKRLLLILAAPLIIVALLAILIATVGYGGIIFGSYLLMAAYALGRWTKTHELSELKEIPKTIISVFGGKTKAK